MRGKRAYATCLRCGKYISQRTGGGPVQHKCPHGRTCAAPAWSSQNPNCDACAAIFPHAHTPRPTLVDVDGTEGGNPLLPEGMGPEGEP